MKVFLSHSTKDAAFVAKLAAALTAAGFEPWLCEVDIAKNENFVARIEQGLKVCDIAMLIWSPDAAKSNWTTEEWTAVLSRQVKEERTRLGIVLLHDHPLPELLRTKNYIRVRDDEQAAIGETVAWLKRRETAQRVSGLQAPVYLPDYRPRDFVGRVALREQLRDTFTSEPAVFLLYGEPGSGKSLLALQFAWDAQKDFDVVLFQTCGQRTVEAVAGELAATLEKPLKEQLGDGVLELPPGDKLAAVKAWLKSRQSLLVLDDVWSADVKQLEPGPDCSVLYTSRQQSLPWIGPGQTAKVETFTEDECAALFHAALDVTFGADEVATQREALMGFAKNVDMLPIAVAVAASLLRRNAATRLSRGVLKLRLDALSDGLHDVNALFAKAVQSRPDNEQTLLAGCAACAQDGFWLPLAAETAELGEDDADEAASALVHASLLRVMDRNRQRFQLHALLRDHVRTGLGEAGLMPFQERKALALTRLFKDWEARWKDCRECLAETLPAMSLLWNPGERDRQNELANGAFLLAQRIGVLDLALQILNLGLQLREGSNDDSTAYQRAAIYGNLAGILRDRGEPAESMDALRKQEAICLELKDPYGLQSSYGGQGVLLRDHGQFKDAYNRLKKQEAICLTLADEQGRKGLALSYGNQGLIMKDWGRLNEAMLLHRKEEAIWVELDNQDELQRCYGNQALILIAPATSADYTGAMALLKKQEKICEEQGIKKDLGRCYGNQAVILQRQGGLQESLDLLKKQEDIYREMRNSNGLQVTYGNQAIALQKLGLTQSALELHQKKEALCIALGNTRSLAFCYWNWGKFARDQGDQLGAVQKLHQAIALFTELKMDSERFSAQADLDQITSAQGVPIPEQ